MKFKILTFLLSCVLIGCATVEKGYKKILKPCTSSALVGNLLFLGPANSLGPGDVFRKQSEGGYGLSFRLRRVVPKEKDRTDMIDAVDKFAACSGASNLSSKLSAKVSAKDFAGSPQASATLATAGSITTSVDGFQWYTLEQTVFEGKIDSLRNADPNSNYLTSLVNHKSYVITRALQVSGLKVTYHFKSAVDAGAKAQLNGIDASLAGNWTSDKTFELTIKQPFFIVGELREYSETGLSATNPSRFKQSPPIGANDKASVSSEIQE